jgi:hypothetical protein
MCLTLVARNAAQALTWGPIAIQPSEEEGRISDQQGWYRGKRLPSLDRAGVLILGSMNDFHTLKKIILRDLGGKHVI